MELRNINLTPTMKCNLRCELCGVLVPHYEYRPQMTAEECAESLNLLFQVVDRVERFQITGGEPFLHPELDKILKICFRHESRFGELWLFSNCAVPIRQNVLEMLLPYKNKVLVHCSDYGVRPEVATRNIDALEKMSIPYRHLKYYGDGQYFDGWVDNGDFVAHHRTSEENKRIFSGCSHYKRGGSWYLRNGQLHWCGRSIRGMELGKIPDGGQDYLDLFEDIPISEKKKRLKRVMERDCITACDYCNGDYGTDASEKRFPAGKQMEK